MIYKAGPKKTILRGNSFNAILPVHFSSNKICFQNAMNTLPRIISMIFNAKAAARLFVMLISLALIIVSSGSDTFAKKKRKSLPLIRDAEIEGLLKEYTAPIFKVAGLGKGFVDVFIVNRRDFNAFVTGSRMFINTGALTQAEAPNEIIGVIAHETGHLIGGHLAAMHDRLEKAQIMAILGAMLGAGAIASGGQGSGAAGKALVLGSRRAIVRSLLSYQRADEIAADRNAITLLNKTGQSSKGMITTFKRLGKNRLFASSGLDPYAQSHPLPRERVALLTDLANASKYANKPDSKSLRLRHNMMRAKIAAYTGGAREVRAMFKRNITGAPARYGDAISTYLAGSPRKALPKINRLIKEQPKNAYLYEMKGEMLLHSGKANAAIKPFKRAIALDKHRSSLLRIQLGHAYLETNNTKMLGNAIKELKAGISRDRNSSNGYGLLARAYARQGKTNLAIAASAEEQFLEGDFKQAKLFSKRAQPKLKRGSPQWLRLQDILDYKPVKKRR